MSEYSNVRLSKLKLKGVKKHKKKNKRAREDDDNDIRNSPSTSAIDFDDAAQHGNWFRVDRFEQITGSICIEFTPYQYVRALDNGNLILGSPHSPGEGPDPEEIFIAVRVTPAQIAIKSGYFKYLAVDKHRKVVGHSDAISNREHFDPIFQDGKLALSASNGCFISIDETESELPYVVARSTMAGDNEFIKIRTNINPEMTRLEKLKQSVPDEEKGTLRDCEINYVKKFQSFQDKKLRLNTNNVNSLKEAKTKGRLHEELLDRRAKMKSDKFCK